MSPAPTSRPLRETLWLAPLAPVALAFTAGIIIDRYAAVALPKSLAAVAALLFVWYALRRHPQRIVPYAVLSCAILFMGMVWHHWRQHVVRANDIRFWIGAEGTLARLRGTIDAEPIDVPAPPATPLQTFPPRRLIRLVVRSDKLQTHGVWHDVSGLVQTTIPMRREDLHVGAEVELVGKLTLPVHPSNPGELDYAAFLRDRGVSALLAVSEAPGAVEVLRHGWARPLDGWLGSVRRWGLDLIKLKLKEEQGIAAALLLGDTSMMASDDWEQYVRTGVVHVLAISGQHLVILSSFLWFLFRFVGVERRSASLLITLLLLGYALMTGARPPIMRAAWMAVVFTVAIFLQRVVVPASAFAFAWLCVAIENPASVFDTGCQLSFLAVAMLLWGRFRLAHLSRSLMTPLAGPDSDADARALQAVIDESRPRIERALRGAGWMIAVFYLECTAIWLVVMPLVAARTHVISPIALLIGPPVVLLSSLALIAGLLVLLTGGWLGVAALPFAWMAKLLLGACQGIVSHTVEWPGAYMFVPDLPAWWVLIFYVLLAVVLAIAYRGVAARWLIGISIFWIGVGVWLLFWPPREGDFRCTFLAVGHGGCVVLETPGGRTLVYDAGAITGPEVTRRTIAPFLWTRGIRRIDDLLISHGDLDHFNGVPALLERFRVDRVTLTPSFADRTTPGVGHTLKVFERLGLATRVLTAGESDDVDGISFEVLHPPPRGPEGNENARSLVLLLRYQELSLLLTGDLEGPGLARLLALPPQRVDVLQAPHHGSRLSNTKELAAWARPGLVISSQGAPRTLPRDANAYETVGARYLATWPHGAVTIRRDAGEFIVETFHTGHRWPIRE